MSPKVIKSLSHKACQNIFYSITFDGYNNKFGINF